MYDARFSSLYARNRQLNPEVLKELLSTGSIQARSRVLEVGCGSANYITAVKSMVGCACWGLDRSAGMLSNAKKQAENIYFQLGNAETLGLQGSFFDTMFSVDVIHHVNDHSAYYQEAYRVLKAGGKICTVTDSEWMIQNRQPLAAYFPEMVAPESDRYPRIAQLREIMQKVGFRQVEETMVEFHYELHDLQPYKDKVFSSLHLISEDAFQRGLEKMRQDLLTGPISGISRSLLLWGVK
jgi:SAM-dependent methyltransferase